MELPLIRNIVSKLESSATNFTDLHTDLQALSACVSTNKINVAVSNFPVTQPISGSVSVSNLPATQAISHNALTKLDNHLSLENALLTGSERFALIAGINPDDEVKAISVDENGLVNVNVDNTVTVSGTVAVSNLPATQPISGSVSITGTPAVTVSSGSLNATCSGTVSVSNFPATQPISGSVSITGTPAVTVSSGSINASCSGSVSVSNFPATQPISGSVSVSNLPATQPVSGTVAVSSVGGTSAVSLSTLPCMYIPNGTNTLNASADKGNLGLTVEYGVGKFNPLVCNSTQRLLVADTDVKGVLDTISSAIATINSNIAAMTSDIDAMNTNLNTVQGILNTVFDDPNNALQVKIVP